VHGFESAGGDVEAETPLGVTFDDVAELPANGIDGDGHHDATDERARQDALHKATEHGPEADVDLLNAEFVVAVVPHPLEGDVGDADHLAAFDVDDLLVEKIAFETEHIVIAMVGSELFIAEPDAIERDGLNLVMTDSEPGPAATEEIAVYANGIDEGDNGSIANAAQPSALKVVDLEPDKFGKEQVVQHGSGSVSI